MVELLPFVILALFIEWCVRGVRRLLRAPREPTTSSDPAAARGPAARVPWRESRWMGACWLALGLTGLILVRPAIGWWSDASSLRTAPGVRALDGPLRDELVDWADEHSPVGLAVGIVADGRIRKATLGHSRLTPGGPPLHDALFEIGSITKTFTGILLARMAGDGLVGLDSRLSDLLPIGIELTQAHEAITLRHLATHTAGLPRLPPGFFLNPSRILRTTLGMDPYRGYRTDHLLRAFGHARLASDPGVSSEYSNFGFGLLGWALGRAAGDGYASAIRDLVVQPLGLEGIEIEPGGRDGVRATGYGARLAVGPVRLGMEAQPWEAPEAIAGAGGLRSTLDGMIGYLTTNMDARATPLRAAIDLAQREHFRGQAGLAIGLAWIREQRDEIGQTAIWHNGGTGGFRSFLGFTEDRRFGVVLLSNSSLSVDPVGWRLLEAMARS